MSTEMANGIQMTFEMFGAEICPWLNVGVSEPLAKISPLRDTERDWMGTVHPSFEKYLGSLGKSGKKIDLNGAFMKTLRGMLSSNRGFDYLAILLELDELGYDCEWQVVNTKDFGPPQNRERVYTIGHLRTKGTAKVFPIEGTNGAGDICQIANIEGFGNESNCRVYSNVGVSPTLLANSGGHHEPKTAIPISMEAYEVKEGELDISRHEFLEYDVRVDGISNTIDTVPKDNHLALAIPNPEESDDKTIEVKIDIGNGESETVYGVWYEKYNCYIAIRRLTPRECFRLQGWSDEYFERAAFVNSDAQLYKQAGNGVTVNVVHAIAEKMNEVKEDNND